MNKLSKPMSNAVAPFREAMGLIRTPFNDVRRRFDDGRVTERAWLWYRLLWAWGVERYAGPEGKAQDRIAGKMGQAFLDRRIARVRRLIARHDPVWEVDTTRRFHAKPRARSADPA